MTRRSSWTCALVLLALPVAAAQLDTNDLLRCHAIASTDQKLACYEALAVSAQSGATAAESARPSSSNRGAIASSAVVEPSAAGASAPGTAASGVTAAGSTTSGAAGVGSPAPAASATNSLDTEANFGLNRRQIEPQPQAQGTTSIKSAVSEITENRQHHITVVLDNGQTWAFIEPEPRLRPGDTVTIKHASLGSFLMLTPNHRSYRVERLK